MVECHTRGPGSSQGNAFEPFLRTADFWLRATGIYMSYKGTQARAGLLRAFAGKTEAELKEEVRLAWAANVRLACCCTSELFQG